MTIPVQKYCGSKEGAVHVYNLPHNRSLAQFSYFKEIIEGKVNLGGGDVFEH
jgi:hypothetical protein